MMLGSWYVHVGSSRRVNGVTDGRTDRQTDRRTAFQLYIYRLWTLVIGASLLILFWAGKCWRNISVTQCNSVPDTVAFINSRLYLRWEFPMTTCMAVGCHGDQLVSYTANVSHESIKGAWHLFYLWVFIKWDVRIIVVECWTFMMWLTVCFSLLLCYHELIIGIAMIFAKTLIEHTHL